MPHSTTLSQELSSRQWEADQEREARFIEKKEAARLHCAQINEVARTYTFRRDDLNCRLFADGTPQQLSMTLTGNGEIITVVCKVDEGELLWFLLDVSNRLYDAQVYIQAVIARVEANRRERELTEREGSN